MPGDEHRVNHEPGHRGPVISAAGDGAAVLSEAVPQREFRYARQTMHVDPHNAGTPARVGSRRTLLQEEIHAVLDSKSPTEIG